jgi:ferrous iron transport protein A
MTVAVPTRLPLVELTVGTAARLAEIRGGRQLVRRLSALGLRVGNDVTVMHRRGGGLVVTTGASRIALGGGIAQKLWVDLPPPGEEPTDIASS